jgi:hypothetical protein
MTSATASMKSRSWLTNSSDPGSSLSVCSSQAIVPRSRWLVGSSSTSRSGLASSSRASATRTRQPPDSSEVGRARRRARSRARPAPGAPRSRARSRRTARRRPGSGVGGQQRSCSSLGAVRVPLLQRPEPAPPVLEVGGTLEDVLEDRRGLTDRVDDVLRQPPDPHVLRSADRALVRFPQAEHQCAAAWILPAPLPPTSATRCPVGTLQVASLNSGWVPSVTDATGEETCGTSRAAMGTDRGRGAADRRDATGAHALPCRPCTCSP